MYSIYFFGTGCIEAKKENTVKETTLAGKKTVELGGQYITTKNDEKKMYI